MALEVLARDSGSLQDTPVPKEYQTPHMYATLHVPGL